MELFLVVAIVVIGAIRLARSGDVPSRYDSGSADDRDDSHAHAFGRTGERDYSIYPATGLPMLIEGPAGIDIEGNQYGFDDQSLPFHRHPAGCGGLIGYNAGDPLNSCAPINPATGLLMISGTGAGVDVGGNPYGVNNDDFFRLHDDVSSSFTSDWPDSSDHHDAFGSGSDSFGSDHCSDWS